MLARIAAFTEQHRVRAALTAGRAVVGPNGLLTSGDRMGSLVEHALDTVPCELVLAPTHSGMTARVISGRKPPVWVVAPSQDTAVCQALGFSYGVYPVDLATEPDDWKEFAAGRAAVLGLDVKRLLLVAGPSRRNPHANHRIELMQLDATV